MWWLSEYRRLLPSLTTYFLTLSSDFLPHIYCGTPACTHAKSVKWSLKRERVQAWWYTSLIPALRGQRQEEFKASLIYTTRSRSSGQYTKPLLAVRGIRVNKCYQSMLPATACSEWNLWVQRTEEWGWAWILFATVQWPPPLRLPAKKRSESFSSPKSVAG